MSDGKNLVIKSNNSNIPSFYKLKNTSFYKLLDKDYLIEQLISNNLIKDKNLSKEKVLEEIKELIEAVETNNNQIHEAADVLYHLIMYLESNNIKIEDVMQELKNRQK